MSFSGLVAASDYPGGDDPPGNCPGAEHQVAETDVGDKSGGEGLCLLP